MGSLISTALFEFFSSLRFNSVWMWCSFACNLTHMHNMNYKMKWLNNKIKWNEKIHNEHFLAILPRCSPDSRPNIVWEHVLICVVALSRSGPWISIDRMQSVTNSIVGSSVQFSKVQLFCYNINGWTRLCKSVSSLTATVVSFPWALICQHKRKQNAYTDDNALAAAHRWPYGSCTSYAI